MSNKKKKGNGKKVDPVVMAAIITLIGSLLTLLVNFEPIKKWWDAKLNPPIYTSTPTAEIIQIVPSETPIVVSGFTAPVVPTDTPFSPPTLPPAFTPTPAAGVMTAQISYNYSSGRAPLHVTFKAFSSFVTHPDGRIETCEYKNVCSYTWDVRLGGTTIHGPVSGGGEFAYTFSRRGNYTVVVFVCRGEVCNYSAASVAVN